MTNAVSPALEMGSVSFEVQATSPGIMLPRLDTALAVNYAAGIVRAPLRMPVGVLRAIMADLKALDCRVASLFEASLKSPDPAMALGLNNPQWSVFEHCLRVEQEQGLRAGYSAEPLLRADFLHSEGGESLIELNYTPACGGFDEELVYEALVELGDIDPDPLWPGRHGEVLDGLVGRLLALTNNAPGMVCLLDAPASYISYRPRLELLGRLLAKRGIDAIHADLDGVFVGSDRALVHTASGRRIDTIWRFFMLDEIETPYAAGAVLRVLEPWTQGTCRLFGSIVEEAKSSKSVLAWLWADNGLTLQWQDRIPETYVLGSEQTDIENCTSEEAERARAAASTEPEAWVLKDPFGHGGEGVLLGREAPRQDWDRRLAAAASGARPAVLQRHVDEASLSLTDHAGHRREGRLNLGIFLGSDGRGQVNGHGGTFVRIAMQQDSKIGLSNGAVTAIALIDDDTKGKA